MSHLPGHPAPGQPMTIPLTRDEAVMRMAAALTWRSPGPNGEGPELPIWYGNTVRGKDETGLYGGYDLLAPCPASYRDDEWYRGKWISDCVGTALWVVGLRRKQEHGGEPKPEWLNQRSLLDDARKKTPRWCRFVNANEVLPGDLVLSIKHVGVVLHPNSAGMGIHRVVDCSTRHGRRNAVAIGGPWSSTCRTVRPLWQAGW